MATKIFSRFLPPTTGEPSIYETLRQHDELDHSDVEERAGMAVDENDLGEQFHDHEPHGTDADPKLQAAPAKNREATGSNPPRPWHFSQNRRRTQKAKETEMEELDDEVPQSLLIEGDQDPTSDAAKHQRMQSPPVLGPTDRGVRAKWQAAQQQQRLYQDAISPHDRSGARGSSSLRATMMDPKEKALWMWANVENLDNFLAEVYEYYTGNGIWSITLTRMLNLMSVSHSLMLLEMI